VLRRNTPVLGIHWCGKRESLRLLGLSAFLDCGLLCPFCEVRVQGCFRTRSPCACSCRTSAGRLRVTRDGVALMCCA
jgi:hypothetical protein